MVTKREKERGRDKLEVWDEQIHTTMHIIDKQQGPTVQTRNYIQYPIITYNGKKSEKECIYMYN